MNNPANPMDSVGGVADNRFRTDGRTDKGNLVCPGRTDRRTDGRTEGQGSISMPRFTGVAGIKMSKLRVLIWSTDYRSEQKW